jgi:hypothetical protein
VRAAPVGVEALNIASNFLQSVRFIPLAIKEVVRASAVGAVYHSARNFYYGANAAQSCCTFMNYEGSKNDQ